VAKLSDAKAKGAPVEWHVYPDATHCWDCKNLDGRSKTDIRGNHVVYRYDATATADSAKRMFEFLDRTWRGK
jgi:dienelactone hydrolase